MPIQAMSHSDEQVPWLALLPVLATIFFYLLPKPVQQHPAVQFLPQVLGYIGLALWMRYNTAIPERMGLSLGLIPQGVRWGSVTGLLLGIFNTAIILLVVPALGGNIEFLKDTPHAKIPTLVMVPWAILGIGLWVEINFRGFLLGRLVSLFQSWSLRMGKRKDAAVGVAVTTSALVFAFDPFLVATFKHLHWIAVWDGIIWGVIWVRLRNLYAVIIAHTVEVILMYLVVKMALL